VNAFARFGNPDQIEHLGGELHRLFAAFVLVG